MTDTGTRGAMAQARRDSDANFSDQPVGSACQACPAPQPSAIKTSPGAELSGVEAHDGEKTKAAAASVGARGAVSGDSVAFEPGTADQQTTPHEAAHTVQQSTDPPKPD